MTYILNKVNGAIDIVSDAGYKVKSVFLSLDAFIEGASRICGSEKQAKVKLKEVEESGNYANVHVGIVNDIDYFVVKEQDRPYILIY